MPSAAVERVLARVGEYRASGDSFAARCPAHDDRTPSLSIAEGADGRALVTCHAGCAQDAVVRALGIEMRDLFTVNGTSAPVVQNGNALMARNDALLEERANASRTIDDAIPAAFHAALVADDERMHWLATARGISAATVQHFGIGFDAGNGRYTIPVRDADGHCVNIRQYKPNPAGDEPKMISWRAGFGQARLFPLDTFSATDDDPVVVAGEWDCLLARQHGLNAITGTGGEGVWRQDWSETFRDHDVTVCYDADATGDAGALSVANRLHGIARTVRIHRWPEGVQPGYDLTDYLLNGGTVDALRERIAQLPSCDRAAIAQGAAPNGERRELRTDLGNAYRFVREHGDVARHATGMGWHVWDGTRWAADATGAVHRLAKGTVRNMVLEALDLPDEAERKRAVAWAMQSESRGRIESMLALARTEQRIATTPDVFDSDPWLLNTPSATVDLRTGEAREHRREDMLAKVTRAAYDATARCPQWDAFLRRVFTENTALIVFLQRLAGYTLSGRTDAHVLPILWGPGANGKSTFLETVRAVLGDYARSADFKTLAKRRGDGAREDIARLHGARFVSAVESSEGQSFDETVVKRLVGGDTVTARHLYQGSFEFTPQFKIFVATNHKPRVEGLDVAIWRRLLLVPFTVIIPPAERDPHLRDRLTAEASGILNWMIAGCTAWQREGLNPPLEVRAATTAYRREMDPIGKFLAACTVQEANATVGQKALYAAYAAWAAESGEDALKEQGFRKALNDKNIPKDDNGPRHTTRRLGIRLVATADAQASDDAPLCMEEVQW